MKLKRLTFIVFFRVAILWAFLLTLFIPVMRVSAHPADMYAQQQTILFTPDEMLVDWKITPGPLLAGTIWENADNNHDGVIDQNEALAWFKPYASQWLVKLDDQPLGDIHDVKMEWPSQLVSLQSGDKPIEAQFIIPWPAHLDGRHQIEFHNTFQETISLNWFSLKSQQPLVFDEPVQNNGQLSTRIYFSTKNQPAAPLTSWESGRPDLPGFTGVLNNAASQLAGPAQNQANLSNQANPISSLLSMMQSTDFSPLFLAGAFLLSLALGSLHALTPGHGKTLVAAYLVGSHGRTRDAVFLGLVVTLTHTGSVLVLGVITLVASRYVLPGIIIPWLEIISGLFVIIFGLDLLIRRSRVLYRWYRDGRREKNMAHFRAMKRQGQGSETGLQPVGAHNHAQDHAHSFDHTHEHGGQPHHHDHDHDHDPSSHGHTHALPGNQVTWKSLLTLGISGGLVPCPDAIAILLVAVALNRILFGMGLIIAFSIGLALVLIGIGIAMVQGFRFITRNRLMDQFSVYVPVISALVVLALGTGLTLTTLFSGSLTSAAKPFPPAFSNTAAIQTRPVYNMDQAKLIYLSTDSNDNNQISIVPAAGGPSHSLTRESDEILGYNLSPDKKTILYSTLGTGGETAIWTINLDGTLRKKLLDCLQSYCAAPQWFPDGKKLIYERRNYAKDAVMLLYSTWWLDAESGQTRPVFRDQQFPSFSPQFSFDGSWLGYISPSNNTLQIYNLQNGQTRSMPYPSAMPEIWSPVDLSFLYWDLVPNGDQPIRHLKRYDLATGKTIDLSGTKNEDDYMAAWSPDGQWIAVSRLDVTANNVNGKEQVWLVKPDGSQSLPLLVQDNVSYGGDLSWSPDGRYLVYSLISYDRNPNISEIWMANIQTGQQTEIISGGNQPIFLP